MRGSRPCPSGVSIEQSGSGSVPTRASINSDCHNQFDRSGFRLAASSKSIRNRTGKVVLIANEVFRFASHVLYGMGARTALPPGTIERDTAVARRARRANQLNTERLTRSLPTHRQLIERIVQHGMQPL
ncbi:hypothetical protein [Sphingomonas sp.]|uniref:hypothetical protein n=1 Tax=Sphingomonas sp. TaxID=28214 RepID=UPI0035C7997E